MVRQSLPSKLAAVVLLSFVAKQLCAETVINNITPRGLQLGGTTTLVIDGADLLPEPKLILPIGVGQTIKPGATANRVEIEVTLDAAGQPGIVPLRVASGKGVSNQVAIGVDHLPQLPFAAEIAGPAALHGNLGAGQILRTAFTAAKGSAWLVDVEAQRLGSGLKPVVRLFDERGTQLAWSPPQRKIDGDARFHYIIPADGKYTVELHEPLYRGTNPAFFRLKIGPQQFADTCMPLAILSSSKSSVQLLGGPSPVAFDQDATAAVAPHIRAATLPTGTMQFTGAAPSLIVSNHPELVEAAPAAGQPLQVLAAAPIGISGIISAPSEEDKYVLPVIPGQRLKLEVFAQQFGSSLDGVLSVRNLQGNQLATGDDRPGTSDPALEFMVPADITQLQLALKDLKNAGGSDFAYRIEIRDLSQPDFNLSLAADHLTVPAGGTAVLPINIDRQGYMGAIDVSLDGLPADVQLAGNRIPAGATMGLITLTSTAATPHAGLVRVLGRAVDLPQPITRLATFGEVPGSRAQPYLRQDFAYAVAEAGALALAGNPQTDKLYQSTRLPIALSVTRNAGAAGSVRFRLITSQPMPKKTIKENNQDKMVDDLARALRLETDAILPADQSQTTVNVIVPGDLPAQVWDLVVVADLLAADNKTVLASVATPTRSFATESPFSVELTSPPMAVGRAGAGEAGKFTGKVNRSPGFTGPVAISLAGLPKELATGPSVVVTADKSEFDLPLIFPTASVPAELKDLKLVARTTPAGIRSAQSNAVPVSVNLLAGEKPAVEAPREVFEDDEKFVALLTEGTGQAAIEGGQKFSGANSLRVTPDQKLNPKLPNLGVAIRENPAPGEYRYMQFAWKKQGGAAICLQLNHDGAWGPASGGKPEASFRYHAGPAAECYGASVQISNELPGEFVLVTRDLFADFGEFTLTGLAFSPVDAEQAFFDHIYLARNPQEFDLAPPKNP
jgi:hypothetical protein